MALQAVYKQFLAAPNSSLLAADATLHYVTTTTSVKGATDIIKHYATLRNQIKKHKESFVDIIEGEDALAVDTETSLEFVTSGGPYLPGLDDNFLADRTVYLPIMHIVKFDNEGKIRQVRQSWDQGSLLKQLDIIGKTGRNWPIRDSKDQIRLITNCLKADGDAAGTERTNLPIHSRAQSTNIMRDPHASLSLFESREEHDLDASSVISPRAGPRHYQRDFAEIVSEEANSASAAGQQGSESPSKGFAKAGAGKNFQPSRLFEIEETSNTSSGTGKNFQPSRLFETEETSNKSSGAGKNYQPSRLFETEETSHESGGAVENSDKSAERFYRPNPKKFNHFEFADGSEEQDAPKPALESDGKKSKHASSWGFEDFVTPKKPTQGKALRAQDVLHWGTENDEVQESPIRKPVMHKPRRDAEPQFEFKDDGTPEGEKRVARPRGATHNTGLGLYNNNLYDEETGQPGEEEPRALGNITNLKDRRKDFDSHFSMADESPVSKPQPQPAVSEDRQKAVKMMDANWSAYDSSPSQKENQPSAIQAGQKTAKAGDDRGIRIGGDGMGGSKGTTRNWLFGDEDEKTEATKHVPGKKSGPPVKSEGFWDF